MKRIVLMVFVGAFILASMWMVPNEVFAVPTFQLSGNNPMSGLNGGIRTVIKAEGQYKAIYENYGVYGQYGSNLAVSNNGYDWTDSTHNIISSSVTGRTFNYGTSAMFDDGIYKAWVSTSNDWSAIRYDQVHYLTSNDGISWTSYGSVLSYGNTYDATHVNNPDVIKVENTYHMYYAGYYNQNFYDSRIIHATSQDGITWTKEGPIFNIAGTAPKVVYSDGLWELFWWGDSNYDPASRDVGYATSTDGYAWSNIQYLSEIPEGHTITEILKTGNGYEMWTADVNSNTRPDTQYYWTGQSAAPVPEPTTMLLLGTGLLGLIGSRRKLKK